MWNKLQQPVEFLTSRPLQRLAHAAQRFHIEKLRGLFSQRIEAGAEAIAAVIPTTFLFFNHFADGFAEHSGICRRRLFGATFLDVLAGFPIEWLGSVPFCRNLWRDRSHLLLGNICKRMGPFRSFRLAEFLQQRQIMSRQ